jgi:hypothetical protein|tara:strand:+ start:37 stop:195 length:159 start_codon:yes stop_codon:yes gene_type:complete
MSEENEIKKYTNDELLKLQIKLNSGSYSKSWMKLHFRQLITYAKWCNGGGKQ